MVSPTSLASILPSTYGAKLDPRLPQGLADPGGAGAGEVAAGRAGSVSVELSPAAQTAMSGNVDKRSQSEVVTAARAELDKLLKAAGATIALSDGKVLIDVSALDRRTLWAVAANVDARFTLEERVVAALKLEEKREQALAGPLAGVRVSGDYASLYTSWLANLDAAGPEEKATSQWAGDRAAVLKGLDAAIAKPGVAPVIEGDPVAAWLKKTGDVVASPRSRDIDSIAGDVRAVIDRQYDGGARPGQLDFSRFDDRSLASVALNKGDRFSRQEVDQARAEVKSRTWASVSSFDGADPTSDPAALGQSVLTRYAAMSVEEREAAGWSQAFYDQVVARQGLTERIRSMFTKPSLLDFL